MVSRIAQVIEGGYSIPPVYALHRLTLWHEQYRACQAGRYGDTIFGKDLFATDVRQIYVVMERVFV